MSEPRVTVIVLSYNNMKGLWVTLRSVLEQDWPNLELLISDDGSRQFNADTVREFIERQRSERLKSVQILHSKKNQGTVRNLRGALAAMTGEYYFNFGADDTFANSHVVTDCVEMFDIFGLEAWLVSGQMEQRASDGGRVLGNCLSVTDIGVLCAGPERLFSHLSHHCVPATVATCYRKGFAEAVNGLDPCYRYSEDHHTFMRMARQGVWPVYTAELAAIHPAGGLANGGNHYNRKVHEGFLADKRLMWKQEIDPYRSCILPHDRKQHRWRLRYEHEQRVRQLYFNEPGKRTKLKGLLLHPVVGVKYLNDGLFAEKDGLLKVTESWARTVPVMLSSLMLAQLLFAFLPSVFAVRLLLALAALAPGLFYGMRAAALGLLRGWYLLVRLRRPQKVRQKALSLPPPLPQDETFPRPRHGISPDFR